MTHRKTIDRIGFDSYTNQTNSERYDSRKLRRRQNCSSCCRDSTWHGVDLREAVRACDCCVLVAESLGCGLVLKVVGGSTGSTALDVWIQRVDDGGINAASARAHHGQTAKRRWLSRRVAHSETGRLLELLGS